MLLFHLRRLDVTTENVHQLLREVARGWRRRWLSRRLGTVAIHVQKAGGDAAMILPPINHTTTEEAKCKNHPQEHLGLAHRRPLKLLQVVADIRREAVLLLLLLRLVLGLGLLGLGLLGLGLLLVLLVLLLGLLLVLLAILLTSTGAATGRAVIGIVL